MIVAILGIAAMPAASYSAAAGSTKKETRVEKLRKELKACKKKDRSRSARRRCESLLRPGPGGPRSRRELEEHKRQEEALSATIIVHVYGCSGPAGGCRYYEDLALLITRLGPAGEALSSIELHPESHTVHVAPGEYEVAYLTKPGGRPVTGFGQSARATVVAGQELEIELRMNVE
jgi:hypothetical protein